MVARANEKEVEDRRASILQAAQWCFLNFGFSKTSLSDIAERAHLSRTLLYRMFDDKEAIYVAVFTNWLTSRHPSARGVATAPGSAYERLLEVSRIMAIDPWSDMVGAPMANEFFEVCERLNPEVASEHKQVVLECAASILEDASAAEVFVLALDGLLADDPTTAVLEERVRLLVGRFAVSVLRNSNSLVHENVASTAQKADANSEERR